MENQTPLNIPVSEPPQNGWKPTTSTGLAGVTAAGVWFVVFISRKFFGVEFTGEDVAALTGAAVTIATYIHPDGGRK